MYSKILVPLDGSPLAERAIDHAIEIAGGTGADLVLLQVVRSPSSAAGEALSVEDDAVREVVSDGQTYLRDIDSRLGTEGVRSETVVLVGDPGVRIVEYADVGKVDVIVMSTHGRGGPSSQLMGGVAREVVGKAACPVLLVKPGREAALEAEDRRIA
jgi:nucleotide-binding universal stress UspA family protein